MEDSWIKRPVWGPAFENGDFDSPARMLRWLPGRRFTREWYLIACGPEDGEFEVVETGLTLDEAQQLAAADQELEDEQ